MQQWCRVCGEAAAGFHFGAFTCEGCKSFFGRTHNNSYSLSDCKSGGKCVITKKNRTACKSCRLRQCIRAGMSKSGSRYGRRSNWFKIHCLLQDQPENANSVITTGIPTQQSTELNNSNIEPDVTITKKDRKISPIRECNSPANKLLVSPNTDIDNSVETSITVKRKNIDKKSYRDFRYDPLFSSSRQQDAEPFGNLLQKYSSLTPAFPLNPLEIPSSHPLYIQHTSSYYAKLFDTLMKNKKAIDSVSDVITNVDQKLPEEIARRSVDDYSLGSIEKTANQEGNLNLPSFEDDTNKSKLMQFIEACKLFNKEGYSDAASSSKNIKTIPPIVPLKTEISDNFVLNEEGNEQNEPIDLSFCREKEEKPKEIKKIDFLQSQLPLLEKSESKDNNHAVLERLTSKGEVKIEKENVIFLNDENDSGKHGKLPTDKCDRDSTERYIKYLQHLTNNIHCSGLQQVSPHQSLSSLINHFSPHPYISFSQLLTSYCNNSISHETSQVSPEINIAEDSTNPEVPNGSSQTVIACEMRVNFSPPQDQKGNSDVVLNVERSSHEDSLTA